MNKAFLHRLTGSVIALIATAPAVVGALKHCPAPLIKLFRPFFVPAWWWGWVWEWMPAVRYPMVTWMDGLICLPGIVAAILVGVGLAVAFGNQKKSKLRRWEDSL